MGPTLVIRRSDVCCVTLLSARPPPHPPSRCPEPLHLSRPWPPHPPSFGTEPLPMSRPILIRPPSCRIALLHLSHFPPPHSPLHLPPSATSTKLFALDRRAIWDNLGLSRRVWGCLGLSGSISGDLELSEAIWCYLGPSGAIWDYLGRSGVWRSLGLSGSISSDLGLYGAIWGKVTTKSSKNAQTFIKKQPRADLPPDPQEGNRRRHPQKTACQEEIAKCRIAKRFQTSLSKWRAGPNASPQARTSKPWETSL